MNREDYPKLDVPARVGNTIFAAGVSEKTVIDAAKRAAARWEESSDGDRPRLNVFALIRENVELKDQIQRLTQEGGSHDR